MLFALIHATSYDLPEIIDAIGFGKHPPAIFWQKAVQIHHFVIAV